MITPSGTIHPLDLAKQQVRKSGDATPTSNSRQLLLRIRLDFDELFTALVDTLDQVDRVLALPGLKGVVTLHNCTMANDRRCDRANVLATPLAQSARTHHAHF